MPDQASIVINGDGQAVFRETTVQDTTAEDIAASIKRLTFQINQARMRHVDPLVDKRDKLLQQAAALDEAQCGD